MVDDLVGTDNQCYVPMRYHPTNNLTYVCPNVFYTPLDAAPGEKKLPDTIEQHDNGDHLASSIYVHPSILRASTHVVFMLNSHEWLKQNTV